MNKKEVKLKIKELLINNLKKFNLSNYKIKIKLDKIVSLNKKELKYACNIYIIKKDYILNIHYHNSEFISYRIYSKKDLVIVRGAPDLIYRDYKYYCLDEVMTVLNNDFFNIVMKLYNSKEKISKKIGNFLNQIC